MKTKKLFLLPALFASVMLLFTGCGNKTAATNETFQNTLTEMGYQVQDIKEQYSQYEHITSAYLAVDDTNSYQIEFYETVDEESAKGMFNTNKSNFEESDSIAKVNTSVSAGNHSKYILMANGEYVVISRIANTMIFAHTSEEYKDEVSEVLDSLGY